MGFVVDQSRNLLGLAEIAEARGDTASALSCLDQASPLFQQHDLKLLLDKALAKKLELQGLDRAEPSASIEAVARSVEAERPGLSPQAAPDGTVTLLYSDIESSTARTAALGDAARMDLLREQPGVTGPQPNARTSTTSETNWTALAFAAAYERCAAESLAALTADGDA